MPKAGLHPKIVLKFTDSETYIFIFKRNFSYPLREQARSSRNLCYVVSDNKPSCWLEKGWKLCLVSVHTNHEEHKMQPLQIQRRMLVLEICLWWRWVHVLVRGKVVDEEMAWHDELIMIVVRETWSVLTQRLTRIVLISIGTGAVDIWWMLNIINVSFVETWSCSLLARVYQSTELGKPSHWLYD